MLDEFRSDQAGDYIAGFPMHPHRGFETVTIMLAGAMQHRDSVGNTGFLKPGSVQWMTAGRGIVHEEMPQQENGLMWGFQLWVNLPAAKKMIPPRYQDVPPEQIPVVSIGAAKARVIVGTLGDVSGPIENIATEPLVLDLTIPADTRVELPFPASKNGFVYLYTGTAMVGGKIILARHIATVGAGEGLEVRTEAEETRLLLVMGNPIGEPIARYGPFVMNTEAEIHAAFADYRAGRLGR
jgi:redox-sensitive bicupin YhaK (pirin superfamily)